jgi:hypothetical protein
MEHRYQHLADMAKRGATLNEKFKELVMNTADNRSWIGCDYCRETLLLSRMGYAVQQATTAVYCLACE